MSENVDFGYEVVTEIPKRTFVKVSKYDDFLLGFLKRKDKIIKLELPEGMKPDYLSAQLKKRKIGGISVRMASGNVYLEKI